MTAATQPVDVGNAEHYPWGDGCDGWHLLKHDDLSVIRERVPPGAAEVRHCHVRSRQFFLVLEGQALLEVDGVRHLLSPGMGLHIAPGAVHQFRNESPADVHFLVISAPRSHGDRKEVDA